MIGVLSTRLHPLFDRGECIVSVSPGGSGITVVITDGDKDKDARLAVELRTILRNALPGDVSGQVSLTKDAFTLGPDLAAAVLLLEVAGWVPPGSASSATFMGQIRFSGDIVEPRGAFASLMTTRVRGESIAVVGGRRGELEQVGLGNTIHRVKNIRELVELLQRPLRLDPVEEWDPPSIVSLSSDESLPKWLRGDVQSAIHRRKNILFVGPPGCGATMYARRIRHYLPLIEREDYLQIKRIHSAAGLPIDGSTDRPFRAPHHTASLAALIGDRRRVNGRPGELELAHCGVLLLDEILEFRANVVDAVAEAIRSPLERLRGKPAVIVASAQPPTGTEIVPLRKKSFVERIERLTSKLNFEIINLEGPK